MSVRIQYAYLKQQTWLYRRNYPKELQPVLGQAFKQSLKTGDARVAKARAAEVNAKFEEIIAKTRSGLVMESLFRCGWPRLCSRRSWWWAGAPWPNWRGST